MHTVYKYVLNGSVLYIGKCDSKLSARLRRHGRKGDNIPQTGFFEINAADIYYTQLPNRTMSDVVESELIRRYNPKYNKAKKSEWDGIPFAEPIWKPYRINGHINSDILESKKQSPTNKWASGWKQCWNTMNEFLETENTIVRQFESAFGCSPYSDEGQQAIDRMYSWLLDPKTSSLLEMIEREKQERAEKG